MFPRILRSIALTLTLLTAGVGVANAAVTPNYGISNEFNKPMCDTNGWERITTADTEYAASDSVATCIASQKYHVGVAITSVQRNVSWQYPSLAAGYTPEGAATCADPRRDTCYQFPVKLAEDGMPVQNFGAWLAPGTYNLSDDIWFAPNDWEHSNADAVKYRNNTEIMVWFAHPGIDDSSHFIAYAAVDGIRFGVMTWISGKGRYVAYVAISGPGTHLHKSGTRVTFPSIWLNPFFRNAEYHGWLSPRAYLWTIDQGFELVKGGKHNNIHEVSSDTSYLAGLPHTK